MLIIQFYVCLFVCFISLGQFTHEMCKKTTEAPGPQVITESPCYKSSKHKQDRCSLKICKEEAHITYLGKAFHILPTMYPNECSVMFLHRTGKTSLRLLCLHCKSNMYIVVVAGNTVMSQFADFF